MKKLLTVLLGTTLFFFFIVNKKENIGKQNTLIVAQGADARFLDPQKAIDTPSVRVYSQIYDNLVKKDNNMNIIPALAETWENIDEKTILFHLRKDVKFHNGESLTAEDVKFTLDRMKS